MNTRPDNEGENQAGQANQSEQMTTEQCEAALRAAFPFLADSDRPDLEDVIAGIMAIQDEESRDDQPEGERARA